MEVKVQQYIQDFLKALDKKQKQKKIICSINFEEVKIYKKMKGFNIPEYFLNMFSAFNGLLIDSPKYFELHKFEEIEILENRFLHFATIGNDNKICFDMERYNSANEFDIVCYNNKYIITSTLSSFITNKIWAWVERGREIWKEEIYKDD